MYLLLLLLLLLLENEQSTYLPRSQQQSRSPCRTQHFVGVVSLNMLKISSLGLLWTVFMVLLSFVCSFYPVFTPLRSHHGCAALMLSPPSLEELQVHCMSILHESSLPIKTRPGYAFSLGLLIISDQKILCINQSLPTSFV